MMEIAKSNLLEHIKKLVDERMKISWDAMQDAQSSANEESKSSAGDKYETGRAMAQIERDRYAKQYELARQERAYVEKIDEKQVFNQVGIGALVETSMGIFFMANSLGMLIFEEKNIMVISSQSPIGIAMLGKKVNEKFNFRGKDTIVLAIS